MISILLFLSFLIIEEATFPFLDYLISDVETRETVADLLTETLAFSMVLAGVVVVVQKVHKRKFSTLNFANQFRTTEVLEGITVWGILVLCGALINQRENFDYFLNRLNASLLYTIPIAVISIGIQSYTEEIIFRGYLLQSLSLRIKNQLVSVLICSLLFGILHVAYGLEAMIGVTLFGCLFCYIVLQRQNLAFATGMHFINNFFFVYLLAGNEDAQVENDFYSFDSIAIGITAGQFLLLLVYLNFRMKKRD